MKAANAAIAPRIRASEEATRWPLLVLGTLVALAEAELDEEVVVKVAAEEEAATEVEVVRVVELETWVRVAVELAAVVVDVDLDLVEVADVSVLDVVAEVEEAVEAVTEGVPEPWKLN